MPGAIHSPFNTARESTFSFDRVCQYQWDLSLRDIVCKFFTICHGQSALTRVVICGARAGNGGRGIGVELLLGGGDGEAGHENH